MSSRVASAIHPRYIRLTWFEAAWLQNASAVVVLRKLIGSLRAVAAPLYACMASITTFLRRPQLLALWAVPQWCQVHGWRRV